MKAVVRTPICPLTVQPRPGGSLADEALFGMTLTVLEQTTAHFWRVRTPYRYEGFAPVSRLVTEEERIRQWEETPKRTVLWKTFCDVAARPEITARPLVTVPLGAVLGVQEAPWEGWQHATLPDGREGWVRAGALGEVPKAPEELPERELRRRITGAAARYLGSPYRWGGKTPMGIDCSGLASMAYLLNGISIWRDAAIQKGFPIYEVPLKRLKPADLLYFRGHIAVYLGEGRYIHSTAKAGSDGVVINSLESSAPDYREDLAKGILAAGSWFSFYEAGNSMPP